MFNTPVLLLLFNRPELTKQVFEKIREVKPTFLYVAADGPRSFVEEDFEKCTIARNVVLNGIDWHCEVRTLFRDQNLGCGLAVSGAITWFFEHVEEGIILEDDTLPDISFFSFCSEMLERYRFDHNTWSISGFNFGYNRNDNKLIVSKYMNMWGWATWRRTAIEVDYSLKKIRNQKNYQFYISHLLTDKFWLFDQAWTEHWVDIVKLLIDDKIDTWDYQWIIKQLELKRHTIYPPLNLVKNIGFSLNATHTTNTSHPITSIISQPLVVDDLVPTKTINILFEQDYIKKVWGGIQKKSPDFLKYLLYKAYHLKYAYLN